MTEPLTDATAPKPKPKPTKAARPVPPPAGLRRWTGSTPAANAAEDCAGLDAMALREQAAIDREVAATLCGQTRLVLADSRRLVGQDQDPRNDPDR